MDTKHTLRPVSDELLRNLEALADIENQKRAMTPGDHRAIELAIKARELAQRVLSTSIAEEEIAKAGTGIETPAAPVAAAASLAGVSETHRALHLILDEWRQAERASTVAATPEEAHRHRVRAEELRAEYQRVFGALDAQRDDAD